MIKQNENVGFYNKNSLLQYEWAKILIDKYMNIICDCKTIADIGCGDGEITVKLLALRLPISKIIALDTNNEMINLASEDFQFITNVKFVVVDRHVENLNYDNKFDCVFSCCHLQWLADQTLALTQIKNSLIKGGHLFIILPNQNENSIFPIGKKIANNQKWNKYFNNFYCPESYYTEKEYVNLLNNIGFNPINIISVASEISFYNINKLRNWIKPICQYYEYLTIDLKENFMNDVIDDILEYNCIFYVNNIILKLSRLEIYAIKS